MRGEIHPVSGKQTVFAISRYYKFLPGEQQQTFLQNLREKAS
jgi:hypothetical protein